ncbi:hypothetical protein COY27_05230 [Candidatus Woesearchaeota archaeon CG_4_10_14_0_2_um_filter_33_13]|nr:MAG: hypothetical protein COY27_05230 [Candidatus Woesearchaeota archaeon CG_4_10_14_0_2_um_filter_33_13]
MSEDNNKLKKKIPEDERDYASEEQGILPEETDEEQGLDMNLGEKDEDVYTEEGREKLEEDSEIEPWEEGFMEGASDAGQLGKDALTGEPLMDINNVVEAEIDGRLYRFVNEQNARKFRRKKELEAEEED